MQRFWDASGRRTRWTTTIWKMIPDYGAQVLKSIDMGVTYNALDLPASMQYPMCANCGAPGATPDRSGMAYGYTKGRLRSIGGFVSEVSYWPNGLRNLLRHTNGITDQQMVEAMPRPSQIAFFHGANDPVERCLRPSFISQPGNTSVPSGGGNATLTVVPAGTGPFQYEWIRDSDLASVGTTQSITVNVTVSDEFYVIVRNGCGFEESQRARVTVGGCEAPAIRYIVPIRQPDGKWLLQPDVTAAQQRQYTWTRVSDSVQLGQGETVIVPPPSGSPVTYRLALSDSCGSTTKDVTLTPLPTMTFTGLVAAATGPTQVVVSWPASPNVDSYVVERRSGATWQEVAMGLTSASFVDNAVVANRSYAYRAYAVRAGMNSNYSNSDVATTRSFAPAVPGVAVTAGPFEEMLAAVNTVRVAVGWAQVTWASILASTDPVPQPAVLVLERHITAGRARMNEALSALGVPLQEYTNRILVGVPIKAAHVNEIQQRAQ